MRLATPCRSIRAHSGIRIPRVQASPPRDNFAIMKTASVIDLRNNFASVSRWIYEGESVAIQKRGDRSPFFPRR